MLLVGLLTSCFHYYYTVEKDTQLQPQKAVELKNSDKYFILHLGNLVYEFTDVSVDSIYLSGTPYNLPVYRQAYKKTNPKGVTRYKKKDESHILDEVHIYANVSNLMGRKVQIPWSQIDKVEIYKPDKGATTVSMVIGAVGVTASVILVAAGISAAAAPAPSMGSSCPYIYDLNGEEKELIGEIYSGAIYPSLERHDYLPLPNSNQNNNQYTLSMANELEEIQNTNLIELLAVEHPANTKVLIDKYGKTHTIGSLQNMKTLDNTGRDESINSLIVQDSLKYNPDNSKELKKDEVILTFKRPENVSKAKLVIRAKNTPWLDYVVLTFHELFGEKYDCWIEKQDKVSARKMNNWVLNQDIPLSVYVEKRGKWKFVDYFNVVGPVAMKEDVLVIDLPSTSADSVKIKLESGRLFWDIDYVGLDFSADRPVVVHKAILNSAIDNYGIDVSSNLLSSDEFYYTQPDIGDEVILKFTLPKEEIHTQSLFLHSQGYYVRKMDSSGEYYRKYLLSFRKKGKMAEFSNELLNYQGGIGSN